MTRWEIRIAEYHTAAGERISERILVATVLEHAPRQWAEVLRVAPQESKSSYQLLRVWLRDYCQQLRTYTSEGVSRPQGATGASASTDGPVPMDVSAVSAGWGGKYGGKYGGKHGGKSGD